MPATDDNSGDKAARLAAQLRANLKRRKEQSRAAAPGLDTKPDDVRPCDD